MSVYRKNILLVALVVLLSYWTVLPLFSPGFFPMHDDTQVARVFEMGKALKDGQFPVRWTQDLGYGYGYPIFNFYAPLAYYVGGGFTLFGIDALTATKLMIGIGVMLSGVGMYLLGSYLWGFSGGILSSILYMYAPYHAVNVYVRGAVGETWAYAFIPFVFYFLLKITHNASWKFIILGSLSLAGVILSHNITALMLVPFLSVFVGVVALRREKHEAFSAVKKLMITIVLGVLLAGFYWVPALLEMEYTNVQSQIGGGADFRDHFVCLFQLLGGSWGYGGSAPGCSADGFSFGIGRMHLGLGFLALVIAVVSLVRRHTRKKEALHGSLFFWFCVAGFLFSVFLMLSDSHPLWESVWLFAFIQYPWRYLVFVSFFVSLLGGSFLAIAQQLFGRQVLFGDDVIFIFTVSIVILVIFHYQPFFRPQTIGEGSYQQYTSRKALAWTASKISDEYLPKGFIKPASESEIPPDRFQIIRGRGKIAIDTNKTQEVKGLIVGKERVLVRINLASFPAWNITVDGREVSIINTNQGIVVPLEGGSHVLVAVFRQTPIEVAGNILTVTGVGILIAGIMYGRKQKATA